MLLQQKKKRNRRCWTRPWLTRRPQSGANHCLMEELRNEDDRAFKNVLGMDIPHFEELLANVTPVIARQDTVMRENISPSERLTITLRFLASGMYRVLNLICYAYVYKITKCHVSSFDFQYTLYIYIISHNTRSAKLIM